MKCPKCRHDNSEGTKFCAECGTRLAPTSGDLPLFTETIETSQEELTTGTLFAGRYQIIEELGKGGMGRVYKVHDTQLNEKVALKLIKPEIASDKKVISRFVNELKLARKISHPGVGRMYEFMDHQGTRFITMEYVVGEDLKSMIRMSGQLGIRMAVGVARQICGGLAEAHRLGVVHRDLKPSNIMIDKDGRARIMDFGIARSLEAKGMTGAGMMIGTPEYMSPEQVEAKDVDGRSDIYSLGVILYEMVTGRLPFEGETALSIAVKHKSEIPRSPAEFNAQIPADLERLILQCLEKDKTNRFQSAEELGAALEGLEKGMPTTEQTVRRRKARTSREITVTLGLRKHLIPAMVILAAVIIVGTVWLLRSRKGPAVPAPSDKPTLAVPYFANNTGDEDLAHWREGLSSLLISDLSQSRFIRVLRDEQIRDILKGAGLLDVSQYTAADLAQLASRGGATHILRGGFSKDADRFRINYLLTDGQTGETVGSGHVEGRGEGSFFTMVDDLTLRVKDLLRLSSAVLARDIDKDVGTINTLSPEAYRLYTQGLMLHQDMKYREAIPLYEKAVEIDPEFAMAYRALATANRNLKYHPQVREYLKKALDLSGRISDRERYTIEGDYYRQSESTYGRAIEAYEKLLDLYPDESIGINNLGVLYGGVEKWDKAAEMYRLCVENEGSLLHYTNLASAYESLGLYAKARDVYQRYLDEAGDAHRIRISLAYNHLSEGEFDLALAEADKAFLLEPTDYRNFYLRGDILYLKGNLAGAEEQYRKYEEAAKVGTGPKIKQYFLALARGQFERAIGLLDRTIEIARESEMPLTTANALAIKAYQEQRLGRFNASLDNAEKALTYFAEHDLQSQYRTYLAPKAILLAKSGDIMKAREVASELRELIEGSMYERQMRHYYSAMGSIALEEGKFREAAAHLEKAIALIPFPSGGGEWHAYFMEPLALAYYRGGDLDKARAQFQEITELTLGRLFWGDIYTRSFYWLGMIDEKQGRPAEARANYEKFLELWKDADPGLAEVAEAKKHLAEPERNR